MIRRIAMNVLWGGLLMAQAQSGSPRPSAQCAESEKGWLMCSARKPITPAQLDAVKNMDGVENVINIRRYSFLVSIGDLFDAKEVGRKIIEVLK